MEVASLHTAFSDPHDNPGQDILPNPAPSASTDNAKVGKAGRPGRSRRFRKQPGGEPSPSSAWHAWRREHEGQLETVFQEHPEAYELFRQAVKSVPGTLEEWQQSRVRWRPWVEWREQHQGPLHEVLADPEGWALFCQMKAQKSSPVNVSYEEWLLLPEQQQQIRSAQWAAWRREHPGPQVLALMLAAETPGGVDEGWQIYRSLRELKGESLPQNFEEWRALPKIRREAALSAWALWRQNHEGRLQDVLADPEGWKLYREMLSFVPAGTRSRSNRSRPSPRQLPATYEEWLQRPEQHLTLATLAWTAWREQHPGKLPAVLADPEGWTLFRDLKTNSVVAGRTAQTAGDSENLVKPKSTRRGGDKAKRNRRKGTPSTFATAAATPMTTATTTTASAALAGDDGNDDAEVKGGISTADEEQQQVGGTIPVENVGGTFFPETYEDWLAWRREKNKRGAAISGEAGEDERLTAHRNNKKRWQRWRAEHPGLLEDVLAAEPEGWHLYSAWMSRDGEKAFFSDLNSWLEVQVATRAWLQWREQHAGALAVVLRNNPEGWPLYRAHVAGQSANSTVQGNDQQQRQLPETLEEWLQEPAQIVQVTADAWNAWRLAHPGALRTRLSEQTSGGEEEPCGWHLLRVLLQFYMPAAGGAVESGDTRAADPTQALELPDSLEGLLVALKRSSRTAWLRWTQQQRRSNLQTRLRDPVGWALYKVMRESDDAAPEFAVTYDDWLQKRAEQATSGAGENTNLVGWSGAGDSSVSQAAGRVTGNTAKRHAGPEVAAVTAWNRWRRQRRGDLVHVLQKQGRGWQLYCNMLAARNKPIPESFAAFKEAREQQQQQKQAEAVSEWEAWREQHGGPLEDVLTDPQGAALYRKMIEANSSNSGARNDERRAATEKAEEINNQWLLWREQHPGPLEVVLAEHPEAVELHCAWLAADTMTAGTTSRRKRKPRGKGGRGTTSGKEAVRRWREWRAQHPGALQQVLAADLAAAAERGHTEVATSAEQGLRVTSDDQEQLLEAAATGPTGWELFCAHAASQGRQMPASFEEWLQQPQQVAQREFGIWRAEHPGSLVDVLRDQEGWQLYVRMKRAAAAAAAEEGVERPEVVEDYDEWVQRGKVQREQQSRRRNRRAKAEEAQTGIEAGLAEQTYQCGTFAAESEAIPPSAAGCHGLESNVFGVVPGSAASAEARVDSVVGGMPAM